MNRWKIVFVVCLLGSLGLRSSYAAEEGEKAPTTRPPLKVGSVPVGKILVLGNSITFHGSAPNIGWTGSWGMAASAREKDFVHRLVDRIAMAAGGRPAFRVRNIADFERQLARFDVGTVLHEELAFEADVVVIAIGENVAALTTDESRAEFQTAFVRLLAEVGRRGKPTILVRSCFWADPVKDGIMEHACRDAGGIFVDLRALGADESNFARSERAIEHAGVAGHPGDRGMQAIADAIWNALSKNKGLN